MGIIRAALEAGAHVVTANKGPVVHGYGELNALARRNRRQFLFEATCLAGVPFFSLFRDTRPGCRLVAFRGIVNVTANLILQEMECGRTFAEGVRRTQELRLAETDPSNDVDGWDAAAKIAIVATVLMGCPTLPQDVARRGIHDVTPQELQSARQAGKRIRLVARAWQEQGRVRTSVAPEALAAEDPLVAAGADALIGECSTDTSPPFTIGASGITPRSTAYDVFADFVYTLRRGRP
jgi:homoserine dehydrogenase